MTKAIRYLRFLASLFLFVAISAQAQVPLPKGVTKVASVEGITEYRLESNGFRFLLFPDQSKPTITVNITYLVGSRHENYGETGMAHLLEHLMFKGTPKNPDIDKQFNKRGARVNGTTSLDRTNYYELVPASDENLKWGIELEADRMVNSFIAKKDLDSEMTVVRNEYELGENSPFQVLMKRLQSVAYDWHNYGNSTIGNRSDIENVGIENLQAFYRRYYQPDNAVLLVAGKFDEARAIQYVAKAFGGIPRPKRQLPVLWTTEPTQDGERFFTVRRKGDIQVVVAAYKIPSNLHADSDQLGAAGFLLGDTPTGRLHKALVETGKAAQVFSMPLGGVDPGLQLFGAVVKAGDAWEPVRDEITRTVEEFHKTPASAQEVERYRKTELNQIEKQLANHESIGVQLSEYIALGDWRLYFLARDDLAKLTPEKIAEAAKAYYRRDNRTVALFEPEDNPQRAAIPAAPKVADVMKDFKAKADTSVSEAFDPSQANIDKRTKRSTTGGVKVALLTKKNRGETVNAVIGLHFGDEKTLSGKRQVADLTGAMLTRGTSRYTREQLADEFDRLKISGGVNGQGANIQTTRENLEAALRLVAHVLKEPAFPESEFEQLRKQAITGLEARKAQPDTLAADLLAKHFNFYPPEDWRALKTNAETLQATREVTLEQVKAFHRDFYGASRAEVAVVGDFDEEKTRALIGELFGDWKSRAPYERITSEFREIASTNLSAQSPDKENAVYLARQNIPIIDTAPDYPALTIANWILGGGAGFDSRLMKRIRQKEGLSYDVGSGLSVGPLDNAGTWSARATAAPQNINQVEIALLDVLAQAIKDGFAAEELENAKAGFLRSRAQARSQDGTVANNWTYNLYLDRTWAFSQEFEERVRALKVADVNAALRKYIDPSKMSVFKAGDFARAAK